jgi:transcriptional regulator with XRE-family HTH domain
MVVPSPFGAWLREKRLERGLSQDQLATLVGMHRLQGRLPGDGKNAHSAPRQPRTLCSRAGSRLT